MRRALLRSEAGYDASERLAGDVFFAAGVEEVRFVDVDPNCDAFVDDGPNVAMHSSDEALSA